jgi:RNase H-like domain found in reverse transcriptase
MGCEGIGFSGTLVYSRWRQDYAKKNNAIVAMQPPTNLKKLRSFIGLVTYYRDLCPKISHIFAPLTGLLGTKDFRWEPDHEAAFKRMKAVVAPDALLHWPDHNKPFHIETDSSDYQLGAVIKQDGRPTRHANNAAQKNYTTIEKNSWPSLKH